MKITPLKNIPDRPEPIFDNTDEEGTDFSVRKVLNAPVSFQEQTTFLRRTLELWFFPCVEPEKPWIAINDDMHATLKISSMGVWKNNIGMLVGQTRVQILEHVIGLLAGLGIDADVFLRSSIFPFRAVSLPTKENCVQDYANALLEPGVCSLQWTRKTFTVAEPTRVDFGNKRWSYAILLPAEDVHELIVDVMVSYQWAIGTQRARVKITEEVMQKYITGARTPSYGTRRRLMKILDVFPCLQSVININQDKTLEIDKMGVFNSRTEYGFNGCNLELLMHEVLDKLCAYGIPLDDWARFVGTIMLFASSHENDLAVMKSIQKRDIKIECI